MPRVTAVTAAQVVPRFVPSASRVETSSDHKFCGSGESHKCEKTEIGKKLRQVVTHFFKMKASLIAVTVSCASVASGVNAQNLCRKFSANNRLDCEFLYDLYESTNGESWTNNTGWNTASSFWYVPSCFVSLDARAVPGCVMTWFIVCVCVLCLFCCGAAVTGLESRAQKTALVSIPQNCPAMDSKALSPRQLSTLSSGDLTSQEMESRGLCPQSCQQLSGE